MCRPRMLAKGTKKRSLLLNKQPSHILKRSGGIPATASFLRVGAEHAGVRLPPDPAAHIDVRNPNRAYQRGLSCRVHPCTEKGDCWHLCTGCAPISAGYRVECIYVWLLAGVIDLW